eukprot:763991-Hanusia_phi.AAC.3
MTWCPRLLSMLIDSGKACLSRGMSSGIPAVGLSLEKENESGLQVRDKATEVSRNVLAPLQMLFSKDMLDARPVAPVSSFSRIFSKTSFANSFSWSFPSPDSMSVKRRKFPLEGEGVNEEKLAKDAWEDLKSKLERIELKKGQKEGEEGEDEEKGNRGIDRLYLRRGEGQTCPYRRRYPGSSLQAEVQVLRSAAGGGCERGANLRRSGAAAEREDHSGYGCQHRRGRRRQDKQRGVD